MSTKKWDEEREPQDAPAWYTAEQAAAWADGWNAFLAAHTDLTPARADGWNACLAAQVASSPKTYHYFGGKRWTTHARWEAV